jgi:hypothetical protein
VARVAARAEPGENLVAVTAPTAAAGEDRAPTLVGSEVVLEAQQQGAAAAVEAEEVHPTEGQEAREAVEEEEEQQEVLRFLVERGDLAAVAAGLVVHKAAAGLGTEAREDSVAVVVAGSSSVEPAVLVVAVAVGALPVAPEARPLSAAAQGVLQDLALRAAAAAAVPL